MSLASFSLDNRVTTYVVTLLLTVGGVMAFQSMPSLEDPEFTVKEAVVITEYPGATASEVADEVSDRIEKAIQKLPQLDYVESTSQPGLSIVHVYIQTSYDKPKLPQVWDELRRKVGDVQEIVAARRGDVDRQRRLRRRVRRVSRVYGDGFSYRELKDYVDDLEKELVLVPMTCPRSRSSASRKRSSTSRSPERGSRSSAFRRTRSIGRWPSAT